MPHTASCPRPPLTRVVAPASTFLMAPKATRSFPNPAPVAPTAPPPNVPDARPYADYTEQDTIVVISQPALGAQGVVVDGRVRDLVALNETQLPIWSKNTSIIGAGAETKLHARNVPVQVGETRVAPGDIIMLDPWELGAVAVPLHLVEPLLELLPQLVAADEKVVAAVSEGTSVQEAFKQHRR
jgi:regulator of RNase E activity RraA